jgi:hypothetical protein
MIRRTQVALLCALFASSCDKKEPEAAPAPAPAPTPTPAAPSQPPAVAPVAAAPTPAAAPGAQDDPTVGMTDAAKAWVEGMRRIVPTAMCEQAYFKACFDLGPGDCERIVTNHFESCLRANRDKVPSVPDAKSGEEAGRLLGMCTGKDFEVALTAAGKDKKTAECDAERAKVLSAAQ